MLKQQILNILNEFKGISLEEMDRVKLMNRIDTKFAFRVELLPEILNNLKDTYSVFEIEGTRMPSYESLYFDDDKFSFYHDHHNGKMSRFKVRFRRYVESELHFLEIKHKFKGRTRKQRIQAAGFRFDFTEEQRNFVQAIVNGDQSLKGCMWNSFRRITLVHCTAAERLTLDIDISFRWEEEEQLFDGLVIAELKQDQLDRNSEFYQQMKQRAIRPYRLSKYCIGSIELHGREQLKYNRFKKKLLKLKQINDDAA